MKFAVFILASLISIKSAAAVWDAENKWDDRWEQAYSQWLQTSWDVDAFTYDTEFKDLKVDCADAVYSARIIFSYLNKLPYAMKDPTGGPNVISNSMTRWDGLSQRQRIRSFLNLVYSVGGTLSLPEDTYPVAVNRQWVHPGTILLVDKTNHHSWTIKDITDTGVPTFIYSTRPARTVMSKKIGMPHTDYIFPRGIKAEFNAGFRNFRKPDELFLPASQITGYSTEQYETPRKSWRSLAQASLSMMTETLAQKLERTLNAACTAAQERTALVSEAVKFLETYSGKCLDAESFDDHSTPNRDLRMKQDMEDVVETYKEILATNTSINSDLMARAEEFASQKPYGTGSWCPIEYSKDRTLSLGEVYARIEGGLLSANPHDTLEYRWGDKAGHTKRAKECPVYQ